jgi:GT2 family glycosyltransferase
LTPGLTLPSRILSCCVSFVAFLGDAVRRARYRCAQLQQISAVEMVSDRSANGGACQWLPAVRVRGGSRVALVCWPNSRVTYDVVLPGNARVVSWCALAPAAWGKNAREVEFEIQVRAHGLERSTRRLVNPRASRLGRRWHALRVNVPEAGSARIVLRTRSADSSVPDDARTLWGDPRIEMPRSVVDLMSVIRSAISEQSIRRLWGKALPPSGDRLYALWARQHESTRKALRAQREWAGRRARLFSLITPVADGSAWRPEQTFDSVLGQSYQHWEWIIVVAAASMRDAERHMARIRHDPRVRLVSVPPECTFADACNAGLWESRGNFAALVGENDTLSRAALYEMAKTLEHLQDCDVLYSDEDRIAGRNLRRHEPHFKPDWSPELLLTGNYIGRLAMMRVARVRELGGFRNGFDACEEWELFLRLSRSGARLRRVPRCLYHRHSTTVQGARNHAQGVLRDHCEQVGLNVAVTESSGAARVVWAVSGQPTVSIIIPNRNAGLVLRQCLKGLVDETTYPHRELVIVDNGSTDQDVLELYRLIRIEQQGTIVPFDRPFNFSAACNAGAAAARGELLLFLNNDIEVIHADWLDELVRWAQLPGVGIVGPMLLYPDRTIQHAGVVFGLGLVGHIFARAPAGASGLFGSTDCYRNYLAVTGACQMMRTDVFRELGGYDERYRLSFSDVVLCMEAWRAGYRVVYTPHARLVHHESYTRQRDDSPEDLELLARYLQNTGFVEDPYFHPELDPRSPMPALRPPFDPTPRQVVREYVERVLSRGQGPSRVE